MLQCAMSRRDFNFFLILLQEVLTAPDRALTQQPGYMQRLGAFTGAARVKRLALKLMVAAAATTPGVLQSSELQRLRVRGQRGRHDRAPGQHSGVMARHQDSIARTLTHHAINGQGQEGGWWLDNYAQCLLALVSVHWDTWH